jgi:hypothetical protein
MTGSVASCFRAPPLDRRSEKMRGSRRLRQQPRSQIGRYGLAARTNTVLTAVASNAQTDLDA